MVQDVRDWTWSSRPAPGRSPVSEWAARISRDIAEMAIESEVGPQFSARWTRYGLGPVELNFLRCSAQTATRTREMIARDGLPNFELLFVRSGPMRFRHGDRSGVVPPGTFVLLDDQLAYDLDFPKGSDCLTVRMPETWLLDWLPATHGLIGRTLGLQSPWGRPLAGLLTAIADGGLDSAMLPRVAIADQLGAMAGMLATDAMAGDRANRRGLEDRAMDILNALHADPDLNPARVAGELSISVRHLHRVLAQAGASFGRRLNMVRLAAAESLLASREGQGLSVGEIAWRVGYADQSHFARLFRASHGCAPTCFRDQYRH